MRRPLNTAAFEPIVTVPLGTTTIVPLPVVRLPFPSVAVTDTR
jgi:hypothetical protein